MFGKGEGRGNILQHENDILPLCGIFLFLELPCRNPEEKPGTSAAHPTGHRPILTGRKFYGKQTSNL